MEIDLFTTILRSLDNVKIVVPNSEITGSIIENFSARKVRRVDVSVGTDYGASLTETREILKKAADKVSAEYPSSKEKGPEVYLLELADSSVNWKVRLWADPSKYWQVRQALTWSVKEALDIGGVSIPYPQMDLRVVQQS